MKPNPLIGIFMSTFNQGQYIDEAIQSLKDQTFQDFEVFIVDDGSTDGKTPEKLKTIEYDKAKIIINKENHGMAARCREYIEKIDNKYMLIFCADDMLAPTFLEESVKFLEENQNCGVVSVNLLYYLDSFDKEPFFYRQYDPEQMKLPGMLAKNHCLGTSLIRSEAIKAADLSGGFTRYQDWDRWVALLASGWKIGLIPKPLFKYRIHSDSLSNSTSTDIELDIFRKMMKKYSSLYEQYSTEVIESLFLNFTKVHLENKHLNRQRMILESEIAQLKNEPNKKPKTSRPHKSLKNFFKK